MIFLAAWWPGLWLRCVPTTTTRLYLFIACEHPLAFVDENRERLLHIDILARRAGHDGEHGMPVVGRGHHHSIDVLVLVHLAKIAVALGIGAFQVRQAFLHARLVDIAHAPPGPRPGTTS